jgi:hypothetical protein
MHSFRLCALSLLALLGGCATPPEVKQALASLDTGYSDNIKMMQQYRDLVAQINEREQTWNRYLDSRSVLISALTWATTDPPANPDEHGKMLGTRLVSIVNCIRLKDLPERKGKETGVVFAEGGKECKDMALAQQLGGRTGKMTGVIQALPYIVSEVDKQVDQRMKDQPGLAGFDVYRTNVQALQTINSTIKRYLDIDQTIKADDLNQMITSIRQLSR